MYDSARTDLQSKDFRNGLRVVGWESVSASDVLASAMCVPDRRSVNLLDLILSGLQSAELFPTKLSAVGKVGVKGGAHLLSNQAARSLPLGALVSELMQTYLAETLPYLPNMDARLQIPRSDADSVIDC